jgi:chemotaxis protein CheD
MAPWQGEEAGRLHGPAEGMRHVKVNRLTVLTGQMVVQRWDGGTACVLRATVNSSLAICLTDPEARVVGLAHIVLPRHLARDTDVGRYADTAVPCLARLMQTKGARRTRLRAILVGGALTIDPDQKNGLSLIGRSNVEGARSALAYLAIPVVLHCTGGTAGRIVSFDSRHEKPIVEVQSVACDKHTDQAGSPERLPRESAKGVIPGKLLDGAPRDP